MQGHKSKGMKRSLIERLNSGPVICAEGFLFEIEKRGYMASGEFVPMVSLDHPEALENLLHKSQALTLIFRLDFFFYLYSHSSFNRPIISKRSNEQLKDRPTTLTFNERV